MSTPSTASSRPSHSLKIAETKDEIEACYDLRIETFVVEQGFPLEVERDDYDPISTHWLLTVHTETPPPESTAFTVLPTFTRSSTMKPIGTIRWTASEGKVSRLVVAKEYRRYGFGRVLMDAVNEHIAGSGVTEDLNGIVEEKEGIRVVKVKMHAQMHAIAFYKKFGYVPEGPDFIEDGAPHQKMVREFEMRP